MATCEEYYIWQQIIAQYSHLVQLGLEVSQGLLAGLHQLAAGAGLLLAVFADLLGKQVLQMTMMRLCNLNLSCVRMGCDLPHLDGVSSRGGGGGVDGEAPAEHGGGLAEGHHREHGLEITTSENNQDTL